MSVLFIRFMYNIRMWTSYINILTHSIDDLPTNQIYTLFSITTYNEIHSRIYYHAYNEIHLKPWSYKTDDS